MTVRVLTGTKQEIAESLVRLDGEVREVIAFVEDTVPNETPLPAPETVDDMFAEMEPYMVKVDDVDDSRESIYTRLDSE